MERHILGLLIEKPCFALLIIAGGARVLFGPITVLTFFSRPTMHEITCPGGTVFLAGLATWRVVAGTTFARKFPVPERIRNFIKAPFHYR